MCDVYMLCSGFKDTVEKWQQDHEEIKEVYKVEDLVKEYFACCNGLREKSYALAGTGLSPVRVHHSKAVAEFVEVAHVVLGIAQQYRKYDIELLDELRTCVQDLVFLQAPTIEEMESGSVLRDEPNTNQGG